MKQIPKFMKVNRLLLLLLIFIGAQTFSIADDSDTTDNRSYKEKLYSGDYVPYYKVDSNDKIKFPINYDVAVYINQLRDIDIKKRFFYSAFNFELFTNYDTLYVTNNDDSIWMSNPWGHVRLIFPESDRLYEEGYTFDDKVKYGKENDSIYRFSNYVESDFPIKWNLRNYPFDKQYLSFVFEANGDTSWLSLSESEIFPPEINNSSFPYLIDGLTIEDFTTEKKYRETSFKENFADGYRNSVREQLIFRIGINRDGSYLYFKLFFGGFLSFLISFLVYFIGKNQFDTRITLSLGGIFGSVGNKYFVENSMPTVQVLTKADLINNLVIIFIILNIFIVIGQHTKRINLWKFEENTFSATFIFILFILVNLFVINF